MRRRSWFNEGLIALAGVALIGCKSGADKPDSGSSVATATAPLVNSAAPLQGPRDASVDAAARAGLGMDAGRGNDAGPDFEAGECASFDPDRWAPYTAFAPETACWLFVPVDKDKLPPIAWEPCNRDGFGARCRKIRIPSGEEIDLNDDQRNVDTAGIGPGRIQVSFACNRLKSKELVVADIDGPVTGALAYDPDWGCQFVPTMRAGGWAADFTLNRLENQGDQFATNVPVSGGSIRAARMQLVPTKSEEPLKDEPVPVPAGIEDWRRSSKSDRVSDALGVPRGTHFSFEEASDGKDVVWSVASSADHSAICRIFTGAWVENPADVVATHVVDLHYNEVGSWTVRCGFAATATEEGQALLLRLKDGMVFRFPKLGAALDNTWAARTKPLALSCKELFLDVGGTAPNVFRVPLDALPAGTPPPEPPKLLEHPDGGI